MLNAKIFGVDEIRSIEHFGRYTAKTLVPRRFIWEKPRERELDCPLIEWRIGRNRFAAVIPIIFNSAGWMDESRMMGTLRSLIAESRTAGQGVVK